jgi:hypothetical protein|tara:strand:- start:26 stop:160 length:135 start_codon:yes stop_codon:yes gene_type:complete
MTQQTEEEIYAEALHKIIAYIDKGGADVDRISAYAMDALYESRN